MEEIDISQLLSYFKSKIIYILFAMSIAFCLSSIYVNRFRVPEYTNSTTILLNKTSEAGQISSTDINLNKSLITTYSEIIRSKRVLRQVIEKLNLDLEYSELVSMISVGEVTDTSIIRISVTNADSKLAADIANSIAEVFSQEIVTIYNIENISVIDKAEAGTVASSASTIKIIGIATVAGAFISVAVIFILFYFDTTLKNEEDIEHITGLPVIGIVPASREKIKYSQHRKYYDDLAKKHKSQEILPIEREVRKIEVTEEMPRVNNTSKNEVAMERKTIDERVVEDSNLEEKPKVIEHNIEDYELDKTIEREMTYLREENRARKESALKDDLTKIKIEALESDSAPDINKSRTVNQASVTKKKYGTAKKATTKK